MLTGLDSSIRTASTEEHKQDFVQLAQLFEIDRSERLNQLRTMLLSGISTEVILMHLNQDSNFQESFRTGIITSTETFSINIDKYI